MTFPDGRIKDGLGLEELGSNRFLATYGKSLAGKILGRKFDNKHRSFKTEDLTKIWKDVLGLPYLCEESKEMFRKKFADGGIKDGLGLEELGSHGFRETYGNSLAGKILGRKFGNKNGNFKLEHLQEIREILYPRNTEEYAE